MMLGIVAPQCVCLLPCHCSLLSSVVQCSCDAEHKPLKEEMGALPGAGHLRVPRKGNKRVCHAAAGGGSKRGGQESSGRWSGWGGVGLP